MIAISSPLNINNLVRWHSVTGATLPFTKQDAIDSGLILTQNFDFDFNDFEPLDFATGSVLDQLAKPKRYKPPIFEGDVINFYINTESDLEGFLPESYDIGIFRAGELVAANVGTLNTVTIVVGGYKIYGGLTIPVLCPGTYNYIIYDTETMELAYISNPMELINDVSIQYTSMLKYRNKATILGFDYSAEPSYYNTVRIHAQLTDEQTTEDISTYDDVNYNIITPKVVIRKENTLQIDYIDSISHDALHMALRHSEVYIDNKRIKLIGGYEREDTPKEYGLSPASTKVQDVAFMRNLTVC
jgi:hypothetical protein